MKLQSAVEYLSTYGWAILIIGIVIAALFTLVIPAITHPNACILAGLSCSSYQLAQNGLLTLNILQSTQDPISVTAVGCSTKEDFVNMQLVSPPVNMPISSNYTFNLFCYSADNTVFAGSVGQSYSGYLIINYTNAYTLFPNTVFGDIRTSVSH